MQPYTEITSRDNERVKRAAKLATSAATRAEEGLFFAEGVRLCLDLAATLPPQSVFFTEKVLQTHPEVAGLGEENHLIMPHVAEKLGGTKTTQGLFCLFPLPKAGFDNLDTAKGILVLEGIQDPTNMGAVLRSAAAFGFGGAVLTGGCADPFSPKTIRGSVGAAARLPIVAGASFAEAAAVLRDKNVHMWAAALQNARPLTEISPAAPFALCIGNEGRGLTEEAIALCDEAVYIPMQSGVESLNAAVAASVLMYNFAAQTGR